MISTVAVPTGSELSSLKHLIMMEEEVGKVVFGMVILMLDMYLIPSILLARARTRLFKHPSSEPRNRLFTSLSVQFVESGKVI